MLLLKISAFLFVFEISVGVWEVGAVYLVTLLMLLLANFLKKLVIL